MALGSRRNRYDPPTGQFERQLIPVLSVMLGSMTTLLPIIATTPFLPSFGFLMLIGWRLLRNDLWPVWAALPLGAFDDLFSGQPLGSSMAIWTGAFLIIDEIDRRLVWRDHKQDWGIAALLIAGQILLALVLVRATGGGSVPIAMLAPQILFSVLLFPPICRFCAHLDRWRLAT